jgi:hypothetical protein
MIPPNKKCRLGAPTYACKSAAACFRRESIVCLSLQDIHFECTSDVVECICLFPSLKRLSLHIEVIDTERWIPPATSQFISSLEYFYSSHMRKFLLRLASIASLPKLQYLHIMNILDGDDVEGLKSFLPCTAPSHIELSLYFTPGGWSCHGFRHAVCSLN